MPAESAAAIAARRRQVADLWLRGMAPSAIAGQLEVSAATITRDVRAIRAELREAHAADMDDWREQSVAKLEMVQNAAWALFNAAPATSLNKTGCLNTIISAEQLIAKLRGTLGPDALTQQTVNTLAAPQWVTTRTALLSALAPYPEAKMAVAEALYQLEAPPSSSALRQSDGQAEAEAPDGEL